MLNAPTTISPADFEAAMNDHWINTLGNVANPELQHLWRTMADVYERSIFNTADVDPDSNDFLAQWSILQPPTGTGKSQGAALYAAMLAIANEGSAIPTHTLIVVRQKKQCAEICATARDYLLSKGANPELCNYHHSDHTLTVEERQQLSILIVCHSAYVNAAAAHGSAPDRFNSFTMFGSNPFDMTRRYLTIIDEALGSVVETSQVTHDTIQRILLCLDVTDKLRVEYPREIKTLKTMMTILEVALRDDLERPEAVYRDLEAHFRKLPDPDTLDYLGFWKKLRKRDLASRIQGGNTSADDLARYRKEFAKAFHAVRTCLKQWRFYAKERWQASINTASFLIPENLVAPVCLDATASNNYLWELLGNKTAKVIDTPRNARNYNGVVFNMALHTGGAGGLGKGAMQKTAKDRARRTLAHLADKLEGGDTLIVSHKRVKPALMKFLEVPDGVPTENGIPEHFELNGSKVYLNHWWALDGLNSYQHCSNVVLLGLPYMDDVWALNMIFALQGFRPELFRRDGHVGRGEFNTPKEYRTYLGHQQITLMVIQAINRVRCRRVVDAEGGCSPVNIWMPLPAEMDSDGRIGKRAESEAIIAGVKEDMPGIQIAPWNFKIDEAKDLLHKTKGGRTAAPFALIAYMDTAPFGETKLSTAAKVIGLTKRQVERVRENLGRQFRDRAGNLYDAFSERLITYEGGRGRTAVLVKNYPQK